MVAMKFKFTIQGYQTDAVNSVVRVFSGQPFQDKVGYRRDVGSQDDYRNLFNGQQSDEELFMGFANAPVSLNEPQLLHNIREVQRAAILRNLLLLPGIWGPALWMWKWKRVQERPMFTSRPCSS